MLCRQKPWSDIFHGIYPNSNSSSCRFPGYRVTGNRNDLEIPVTYILNGYGKAIEWMKSKTHIFYFFFFEQFLFTICKDGTIE